MIKKTNPRTSNYTGVGWNRKQQNWRSSVTANGIKYDCGYHDTEREAAKARDRKILALGLKKPLQILKPAA
ncbi:AP2 domain-containing protein [uncultured Flavobacterium sp.]|uniref:AP2 domain-containing protein n=1 Tax=uncultured Flavobacterium sp. TaxID=165435 RepID=UPI0025FFD31B|nr:AP2 domain-containing protein [uncultured Flavobacterium sp.]